MNNIKLKHDNNSKSQSVKYIKSQMNNFTQQPMCDRVMLTYFTQSRLKLHKRGN